MAEPRQLEGPASTTSALWLSSPAAIPALRIGLLLNGPKLPRYCARIIEQIQASNFARIELLVYRQRAQVATPPVKSGMASRVRRLFDAKFRKRLLYELYLRFDERKKTSDHPRIVEDCAGRLAGIESIHVEPIGQRFVQRFPEEAVEQIRAKNLDVLIRFGFNILKGDILSAARYGVWSYHHGDNEFYRGGPPHFWELYERNPLSGAILQVLTEELDGGLVLSKSLFTTEATISVSQNNFGPYWGAADLMIQKLNELHRFGWDYVQRRAVPPAPYKGKRPLYRTPSNFDMARWLAPIMAKKAAKRPFRRAEVQHWKIGIRLNAPPLISRALKENLGDDLQDFRWIESPRGHFWADPFVLEQDGRKWIFFEDYIYAQKRGFIACAEIGNDGDLISPSACLENPEHHYSYPYVFREGEELYMLPEARDSGAVDLYRCEEFPNRWSRQATLLRGKFVDPTIWQHDGLWWLMVTSADPDARSGSLFLFYAEALGGKWNFHPSNPISTDARFNRGAGTMVWSEGRLIRPSQSSCPVYGYSFSFNEVTALSTTEYAERPLREFKPESVKLEAMHTYNWIPGVEVIDGAKDMPLPKV